MENFVTNYWQKYKYILFALSSVFLVSSLAVFIYVSKPAAPPQKPIDTVLNHVEKIITEDSVVYLKDFYPVCANYFSDCGTKTIILGDARDNLNGKNIEEIKSQYPNNQGWKVEWDNKDLIIVKINFGLCKDHLKMYHLLPDRNGKYIVIYYGPSKVGKDGGIYKETNLLIQDVPKNYQNAIINGNMEFINEEELIATLDSLSEHGE